MASKALIIGVVVLLVLVGAVVIFIQFGSNGTDTSTSGTGTQGQQQGQTQEEQQTSQQTPPKTETQPEMQPSVKEFFIEADDRGFYINGADIGSISAGSGEALKITFNVRTTNVYYGGLDFRGCGQETDRVSPGGSTTVEFTATSTCTITSYWPSSSRVKDNLQVVVG